MKLADVPATLSVLVAALVLAGCTAAPTAPEIQAPTDTSTTATGLDAVVSRAIVTPGRDRAVIAGYVAGVLESGGACVFTLQLEDTTVTRQSEAIADATTTACPEVEVPVTDLTSGTWSVTLDYTGTGGVATSSALALEVP